jgi:hypothetical protein
VDSRRGDFANPTLSRGPTWKNTARYQESPQPRTGSCSLIFGPHNARVLNFFYNVTDRPWDSANGSSPRISPRHNWLALPLRPQLRKPSRNSRMLPLTAQRSARKYVFNCSPTWNYYTRVFKTNMVSHACPSSFEKRA